LSERQKEMKKTKKKAAPRKDLLAMEKQVKRWWVSLQEYRRRSEAAAALAWTLRRMEFSGIINGGGLSIQMIVDWLKQERVDHCRRVQEQAAAQAQLVSNSLVRATPAAPQVADDTPLMIDHAVAIIEKIAVARRETAFQAIQGRLEAMQLSLRDHMQMMIEECQVGLEKIKLLICRPKPKWGQAGDVLMPMWKTLIEEGIKHEICMRFKPDPDGPKEQFGGDITIDDLYIETRAERAERERSEADNRRG